MPAAPARAVNAQIEQHATRTTLTLTVTLPEPKHLRVRRERAMSLIGEKSDRLLFAELGLFPAWSVSFLLTLLRLFHLLTCLAQPSPSSPSSS